MISIEHRALFLTPFWRPWRGHHPGLYRYRPYQALEIVWGFIYIRTDRLRVLGLPWELMMSFGRPPILILLADHLKYSIWVLTISEYSLQHFDLCGRA